MVEWKEKFVERFSKLTDIDEFLRISLEPLPKTIRVNTLKTTAEEMKKRMKLSPIPWCSEGFIAEGYALGNTLEHFLGYFYLQSAASMIPPVVLEPKEHEMILDMCASPGSKTSQIAAMMKNTGMIVANDSHIKRLKPLSLNLQRCGVANALMTITQGQNIKNAKFDRILVDAPCSGIGTIRKSYKTIQMWNPYFSRKLCNIQKNLLTNAYHLAKENGVIVYSTCTLEPEENESVVDAMLKRFPGLKLEKIKLDIQRSKPVMEFDGKEFSPEVEDCLRIWPQDNNTEGFFVAKFRKTE
ncbi:RsmB/NOP family class I SAM-dependent RNA methyltransferase [Candidatus Woesearchaeota archaeon]|nr:RsmB/NOP family class I SAM-dependent RNA methyltransferase [Candidatus Woesearchaeota archaeon]